MNHLKPALRTSIEYFLSTLLTSLIIPSHEHAHTFHHFATSAYVEGLASSICAENRMEMRGDNDNVFI